MILKILTGPLIGMIIGYFTNWLAVRMLFRPREARYLFGKRIPFTPGVIPRGKERIAASLGDIVNTQLLTEEAVSRRLTSKEMTDSVRQAVSEFLDGLRRDERTLRECFEQTAGEERWDSISQKIEDLLIRKASEKLRNMNLGKTAAGIIADKMNAALSDSFLGKMFGDSLTSNLSSAVEKTVNEYIDSHGEEIVRDLIREEKENLLNITVGESAAELDRLSFSPEDQAVRLYMRFAEKKAGALLRRLDVGGIARQAVLDMSSEELEHLILSAIRTELRAVVNLGAVIGLLLGLLNLLIYVL